MTKLIMAFLKYAKALKESMQRHAFGIDSADNLWNYLGQHVCLYIMIRSNVRAISRAINHRKLTDDLKKKYFCDIKWFCVVLENCTPFIQS